MPRLPRAVLRRSVSGEPRAILVMGPAEDRSRDGVLTYSCGDVRQIDPISGTATVALHGRTCQ